MGEANTSKRSGDSKVNKEAGAATHPWEEHEELRGELRLVA